MQDLTVNLVSIYPKDDMGYKNTGGGVEPKALVQCLLSWWNHGIPLAKCNLQKRGRTEGKELEFPTAGEHDPINKNTLQMFYC